MRSAFPLLAASLALALGGQALAEGAGSTTSPSHGAASPPETSSSPPATSEAPSTAPPSSSAPSATTEGSNTSATAGKSFTVGETVKDSTGASIGTITSVTGSGDAQMAVIKMGDQSFQVQANRLGSTNGAAEIAMTKAQIQGMLKGGGSSSAPK